ncbi:unnamed protein product [Closterium sp. NIES-54]
MGPPFRPRFMAPVAPLVATHVASPTTVTKVATVVMGMAASSDSARRTPLVCGSFCPLHASGVRRFSACRTPPACDGVLPVARGPRCPASRRPRRPLPPPSPTSRAAVWAGGGGGGGCWGESGVAVGGGCTSSAPLLFFVTKPAAVVAAATPPPLSRLHLLLWEEGEGVADVPQQQQLPPRLLPSHGCACCCGGSGGEGVRGLRLFFCATCGRPRSPRTAPSSPLLLRPPADHAAGGGGYGVAGVANDGPAVAHAAPTPHPPPPPPPPSPPFPCCRCSSGGRVWGWRVWVTCCRLSSSLSHCCTCVGRGGEGGAWRFRGRQEGICSTSPCCSSRTAPAAREPPLQPACRPCSPRAAPATSCPRATAGWWVWGWRVCEPSPTPPPSSPTAAAAAEGGGCVGAEGVVLGG